MLRQHALAIMPEAYADAVERALAETGLARDQLPQRCPYTLDDLLTADLTA